MKILKTIFTFAIAGILLVNCKKQETKIVTSTKATEVKTIAIDAKLAKTSFRIDGMTCAVGCAKTIEKELSETTGVKSVTVDFEKKSATVEYDSNTQSPEKLVEIVEKTGDGTTYKVSNVVNSQDKAMIFEQEKPAKTKSQNAQKAITGAKPSCCSAKKHCNKDEKKETM